MPALPRRQLLISTAVGAAAVVLPAEVAAAARPKQDPLTRSRFLAELSRTFTLTSGTATWSATLAAVEDLPTPGAAGDEGRFAVRFEWSGAARTDGTFRVSRPGFSPVDLFCVAGTAGRRATAIVNRG